MNPSKGLRILDYDKITHDKIVELTDILIEIPNGEQYVWSIQEIKGMGDLKLPVTNPQFSDLAFDSDRGVFIKWNDLKTLSGRYYQIIWLYLIGCKDEKKIERYKDDQEMYESCDMVIVMFDSSYWEIFTKDYNFYDRLIERFEIEKYLETDFQKEYRT